MSHFSKGQAVNEARRGSVKSRDRQNTFSSKKGKLTVAMLVEAAIAVNIFAVTYFYLMIWLKFEATN